MSPDGSARDPYRELFERSADAILIIEGDEFVDCNEATVRMLRHRSKEELLRTHPSELSPPTQPDGRDSYDKANEMMATAFARGSHRFEWEHVRADGEVFPVEVLLTAVRSGERPVLHVVWRDITERKRLESQLHHAQKMEAIGKLAGGIAHDFNNLLVVILGHSELLLRRLRDQPDALQDVRDIKGAGERAAQLVRQLLIFSRKQELRPTRIDLNHVLEGIRSLLDRLIGEGIAITVHVPDAPTVIKADSGQIEQVVINLAANARDAMPGGGAMTIALEVIDVGEATMGAELEPGRYAMIAVTDSGQGMSAETLTRAFEPFFTTKDVGRGTGLGLATVYGIAKGSGGTVTLTSSPGHGTTARVFFPLSRDGVVDAVPIDALPIDAVPIDGVPVGGVPVGGGAETILVVEDEPAVSQLELRVLRGLGYAVLHAPDGVAALSLFLSRPAEIDLVLTDVVMPRMGGVELVAKLLAAGHRPRVLFASGYTNDAIARLERLGVAVDLLEKPFGASELAGRVRLALDRP